MNILASLIFFFTLPLLIAKECIPTNQTPITGYKAGVLLLHGLNLKPEKMGFLADWFKDRKIYPIIGHLHGHRGTYESFKKVSSKQWVDDVFQDACRLKYSLPPQTPLYALGYSLGALSFLNFLKAHKKQFLFKKMIFLAPAIKIPWYAKIPELMAFIAPSFSLPSFNLEQYRLYNSTPLQAYTAMGDARKSIDQNWQSFKSIPALIVMDPKDKLVNYQEIKRLLKRYPELPWTLHPVETNPVGTKDHIHHLIIDQNTLGFNAWKQLQELMHVFLAPYPANKSH